MIDRQYGGNSGIALGRQIADLTVLALAVTVMLSSGCGDVSGALNVDSGSPPLKDVSSAADSGADTADVPTGSECLTDSDCLDMPDDCSSAACVAGICQAIPAPDYTPCNDNNICSVADTCQAGLCIAGSPRICDEHPCTAATCDPLAGCVYTDSDDGVSCDDGDPCTDADVCDTGTCAGLTNTACTCTADVDCLVFEDGNHCNGSLKCVAGSCKLAPETVVVCEATSPCLSAVCVPATGQCLNTLAPDGASCDDLNPCTAEDSCTAGVCKGKSGQCECYADADCAGLQGSNYNLCQGSLSCQAGVCAPDSTNEVSCESAVSGCAAAICDPQSGLCSQVAAPDGTSCTPTDPCVDLGVCQVGSCVGEYIGEPCDDANPCTADFCEPTSGCFNTPLDGTSCDDGDPCTVGDSCQVGLCEPAQVLCDDGNPCTNDACEPGTETCSHTLMEDGATCAEASACLGGGMCQSGACQGGTPLECDDENPCTSDICEPGIGCVHLPVAELTVCDDGDACTQAGECEDGLCKTVPLACSDGDPCTLDACEADVGCVSTPAPDGASCDSADPCTEGATCQAGSCQGGAPLTCDDGPCDMRACNKNTGACEVTKVLADGTTCGPDTVCFGAATCDQGSCVPGIALCNDNNPCTTDTCDGDSGACGNVPITCSQGSDICAESLCAGNNGECQQKPVGLCASGPVVSEVLFTCDTTANSLWTFEALTGGINFEISAVPSVPILSPEQTCVLNFNDGDSFESNDGTGPHATATGPPLGVSSATTGNSIGVRFWQWWETDLGTNTDIRFVGLVDGSGTLIDEHTLDKAAPTTWHPVEVQFQVPVGTSGPFRLRFRFDAVDIYNNGGRGWLVDRILVTAP